MYRHPVVSTYVRLKGEKVKGLDTTFKALSHVTESNDSEFLNLKFCVSWMT